jgi:outer membrane protein OmpA-like peptidoglycan-associated protein
MVVRDYLVQNFRLNDTRIGAIGLGKTEDAAENGVAVMVYTADPNRTRSANGSARGVGGARP